MFKELIALLDAMPENESLTYTFRGRKKEFTAEEFDGKTWKEPAAEKPTKGKAVAPVKEESSNPQVFLDMANDHLKAGELDKGIEALVKGQIKHPKNKTIKELLYEIRLKKQKAGDTEEEPLEKIVLPKAKEVYNNPVMRGAEEPIEDDDNTETFN